MWAVSSSSLVHGRLRFAQLIVLLGGALLMLQLWTATGR